MLMRLDAAYCVVSLLAGTAIFAAIYALLIAPTRPVGPPRTLINRKQIMGVQAWLDKQQLEISAQRFITRGLVLGLSMGLVLALVVGAIVLLPFGIVAGFMMVRSQLERDRDLKQIEYNKQLAGACDILRNAFGVTGSFQSALSATASYGGELVQTDFSDLLLGYKQGTFIEKLQEKADQRRSVVFDTLSNTLIRASSTNTDSALTEMLARLADSTRMTTAAFDDAVTRQISAREQVIWAAFGPWGIFAIMRLMILGMTLLTNVATLVSVSTFFSTVVGNLLAATMAIASAWVYSYSNNVARRGLVIRRVSSQDARPRSAAGPARAQ